MGLCLSALPAAASLASSHDTQLSFINPDVQGVPAPASHSALVCHCFPGNKFIFLFTKQNSSAASSMPVSRAGEGVQGEAPLGWGLIFRKSLKCRFSRFSGILSKGGYVYDNCILVFWGFFGRAPEACGILVPTRLTCTPVLEARSLSPQTTREVLLSLFVSVCPAALKQC